MNISNEQRREAAAAASERYSEQFEPIDLNVANNVPPGMTRAFINNRFIVMIFDDKPTTHGPATHALIQTLDNTPIDKHWSSMQQIKNQLFGPETTAIEYYPAESELIDNYNIYWMWVFPDGIIPKMI